MGTVFNINNPVRSLPSLTMSQVHLFQKTSQKIQSRRIKLVSTSSKSLSRLINTESFHWNPGCLEVLSMRENVLQFSSVPQSRRKGYDDSAITWNNCSRSGCRRHIETYLRADSRPRDSSHLGFFWKSRDSGYCDINQEWASEKQKWHSSGVFSEHNLLSSLSVLFKVDKRRLWISRVPLCFLRTINWTILL